MPKGSKYSWQDDTTLIEESDLDKRFYKGMYQIGYEEIKEMQDYFINLEEENLPEEERTEFSPITNDGFYQIKGIHIKEMRESVEKLLVNSGQTLQDFFNYDEGGNHIVHPKGDKTNWTDDVIDDKEWDKFQVKAIHIEELRHYIAFNDVIGWFYQPANGWKIYRFLDKDEYQELDYFSFDALNAYKVSVTTDTSFFYCTRPATGYTDRIDKFRKSNGELVAGGTGIYFPFFISDVTIDDSYIWMLCKKSIYDDSTIRGAILRVDKNDLNSWEIWKEDLPTLYVQTIVCDKNYLYIYGRSSIINFIPLYKINKETKNIEITRDLYTSPVGSANESGIGIDENYIYMRKAGLVGGDGGVIKLNKSFVFVEEFTVIGSAIAGGCVVAGKEYVYILDSLMGGFYPSNPKLFACNKSGGIVWSIDAYATKTPHYDGYPLATVAEYVITLSD